MFRINKLFLSLKKKKSSNLDPIHQTWIPVPIPYDMNTPILEYLKFEELENYFCIYRIFSEVASSSHVAVLI